MRIWVSLLLVFAACAEEAPAKEEAVAWPADGYLRMLPPDVSVIVRLPAAAAVRDDPVRHEALLRAFGHPPERLCAQTDGVAPDAAPGLALTPSGAWVHYLPAADKARLNRALGAEPGVNVREEGRWIVRWRGGKGAGGFEDAALPPGDLAVRVRSHPLLAAVAQPGDTLELGLELGGGGFDFHGRLRPAVNGPTAELLERAHAGDGGLVDFIPATLGLRVETTLPPTLFATWLTRRLVAACGLREDAADAVVIERLLREALSGADPRAGLAFGLEFREQATSFVAMGRIGPGPASPVLAKLRARWRNSYGSLILDARDEPGLVAFRAWVADGEARIDGLPEAAWPAVGALCGGEEQGLKLAYAEEGAWWVFAGGPRADLLARDARRRLAAGTSLSPGSQALSAARDRGPRAGDYVLGVVVTPSGFEGLPAADREALRGLLGAGPRAVAPETVACAGFRVDGELELRGRALYANP